MLRPYSSHPPTHPGSLSFSKIGRQSFFSSDCSHSFPWLFLFLLLSLAFSLKQGIIFLLPFYCWERGQYNQNKNVNFFLKKKNSEYCGWKRYRECDGAGKMTVWQPGSRQEYVSTGILVFLRLGLQPLGSYHPYSQLNFLPQLTISRLIHSHTQRAPFSNLLGVFSMQSRWHQN